MAAYQLIASETTTQVVSPTIAYPVEYCTIKTSPSGVIASMVIDKLAFDAGTGSTLLAQYAAQIETIMGRGHVIAGTGSQSLDANGLLADNVVFTVQYVPSGSGATSITAEAVVPNDLLMGGFDSFDAFLLQEAEAIVDGVYANLVATAGG